MDLLLLRGFEIDPKLYRYQDQLIIIRVTIRFIHIYLFRTLTLLMGVKKQNQY